VLAQLIENHNVHVAGARLALRKILVATDFSGCSEKAVHYALGIAPRYGSHVFLVHAVHASGYYLGGPEVMAAAVDQAWRDAAYLEKNLLLAGSFEGLHHEVMVTSGPPWEVLSEFVQSKGIDLVVVGTHGRSGLPKFLLGSCAEKIFRRAVCPVLTVGPNTVLPGNLAGPLRHVLLPTDLSAAAEQAAGFALDIAHGDNALLTVLHVLDGIPGEPFCEREDLVNGVRARVRQWLEQRGECPSDTRILVEIGSAAETILGVAERGLSDLIVMGIHAPCSAEDFLAWPIAYKVVCESTCPVLTVRATREES